MPKKYTFNVYPKGDGHTIYRVIEFPGNASLDKLCEAIMKAFDFIHEHMYEFCMDNRPYTDYNYQSHPDYPGQPSTKVKIDQLGLAEKQTFSLHYDFGDDWMFTIKVVMIEDIDTAAVPKVMKAKGTLIQYPSWDDEEDEDDNESI